jgi:hypothetical protein
MLLDPMVPSSYYANPDARQRQHHTPTLRSLEPYIIIIRILLLLQCMERIDRGV